MLIWTVANGMYAENERTIATRLLPDFNKRALNAILEIRAAVGPIGCRPAMQLLLFSL